MYRKGKILIRLKRNEDAIKCAYGLQSLFEYKKAIEYLLQLYDTKEYKVLAEYFGKIIAIDDKNALAHYHKAKCLKNLEKYKEAMK